MDQQTLSQTKKLNTKKDDSKKKSLFNEKVTASFKSGLKDSYFNLLKQVIDRDKAKTPVSIQSQIKFKNIYSNGICQIDENHYNMCVKFEDINYRLASLREQTRILTSYLRLLNYFDPTVAVQISSISSFSDDSADKEAFNITSQNDEYKIYRDELHTFLVNQLKQGNNGLKKNKYITFTIESNDYLTAQSKLNRIAAEVINQFKSFGVSSRCLTGIERIELLHDVLNNPRKEKLNLSSKEIALLNDNKINPKSYIVPQVIDTTNKNIIKIKNKYGSKYYSILELQITAPMIYDTILAEILDMNSEMIITTNFNTIGASTALKLVKAKQSALVSMSSEIQKKAVREGYDMDSALPPDLQKNINGANDLYDQLTQQDEKMFVTSFYITLINTSKKKLEEDIFQAQSIIQKHNCLLTTYDYAGIDGLNTFLPLGRDDLYPSRTLTSKALAIFCPFTTQELFMAKSIYYGLNKLSSNMIMANRKELKNPNGLYLGVPGSGKSFASKLEMIFVWLTMPKDYIMISDPEGEYSPLVHALNGSEIVMSLTGNQNYLNPLDMPDEFDDEENPITTKQDLIKSMMEIILNRNGQGLEPLEVSALDRATNNIYRKWIETRDKNDLPLLSDLRDALQKETNSEAAQMMAEALYSYTDGSLNLFNHHSTVNTNNRLVSFNIKDLPKSMKKLGMLILQDAIWNRVSKNRSKSKEIYTWVYFDEFHLLLKEPQTASFSVEIWKRLRKWGGVPTGMTQNVKDFLASQEIENIFDITDFYVLLSQGAGDKEILGEKLEISESELSYIDNVGSGEGLIKFGHLIVPFINRFPTDSKIFDLINTSPKFAKKKVENNG